MSINFNFILIVLYIGTCLQASQIVQKENTQQQQIMSLELQMIADVGNGSLSKEKLQHYLKQNIDLNFQDADGNTALMHAVTRGQTAIVQLLIIAGADLNMQNNVENTALMDAAGYYGDAHIAQLLIEAGARLDIQDKSGFTALINAALHRKDKAVQRLIAAGADLNMQINTGKTALMFAAENTYNEIVQMLIAAEADPYISNEKDADKTARDYACNKDGYDKTVSEGIAKRKAYLARQAEAKAIIEEEKQFIPALSNIIAEYAYGISPVDLPPNEGKKSDDKAGKKSNCVVQ